MNMFPSDVPEIKPVVSIDAAMLPQISSWKVGESYEVIVKMKMTGIHVYEGEKPRANFEIQSMDYPEADDMDLASVVDIANNAEFSRKSANLLAKTYSGKK